jgi:hypothetical protein
MQASIIFFIMMFLAFFARTPPNLKKAEAGLKKKA